VEFKK